MAKQLKFTHEGTDYTLEFTREVVRQMEREGFVPDNLMRMPMNTLPKLFAGSFRANHRYVKQKNIDAMFMLFTNKEALLEKLVEMYMEPVNTMMEDSEEGNAIAWEATF